VPHSRRRWAGAHFGSKQEIVLDPPGAGLAPCAARTWTRHATAAAAGSANDRPTPTRSELRRRTMAATRRLYCREQSPNEKSAVCAARVGMVGRIVAATHSTFGNATPPFRWRLGCCIRRSGGLAPDAMDAETKANRQLFLRSEEMPKEDHGDRQQRHPRTCRRMVMVPMARPSQQAAARAPPARALPTRVPAEPALWSSRAEVDRPFEQPSETAGSLLLDFSEKHATPPSERCPQNWPRIYIGSSRWAAE
jgi:hypothetical protein